MPIPPDDILFNKAAIIERCIRRIAEEYRGCPGLDDFTRVDAMTLNIERACQASIDMAMHVVANDHLGVPQSSAGAFTLLEEAGRLDPPIAKSMRSMAGFRNVAVHQYQDLDLDILRWIAVEGYRDWVRYCAALGAAIQPGRQ
jgi:uncharacterized protein YutE (UPF0331/DUF86 family)